MNHPHQSVPLVASDGAQAKSRAPNRRLLRLPEVKDKVGLSRTAIYKLIAEGQFPRQVCIGPRTVAWCQDDLEAWIEQRIRADEHAVRHW
jgi:prophage regulatory protein